MEHWDIYEHCWEANPNPSDEDILAVCRAWVSYQNESRDEPGIDDHPHWWGAEAVISADSHGGLPFLWRVIRCLASIVEADDEHQVGMLGAGPLEDMIGEYGDRALDLIEPAADESPVLLEALEHVWSFESSARPRLDRFLRSRGRGRD